MKITIAFDFHDVFVDAKGAWISTFEYFRSGTDIVMDYNNGMSKHKICLKYNLSYSEVEEFYRSLLYPIQKNI